MALDFYVVEPPGQYNYVGFIRGFAAGLVGYANHSQETLQIVSRAEQDAIEQAEKYGAQAIVSIRYAISLSDTSLRSGTGTAQFFTCIIYGQAVSYTN